MRTLQEKYNAIQEGKFTKEQFLRDVRMQQPNLVTKFNGYDDAVKILKNRGMIQENKLNEDFTQYSDDALTDMIVNLSRYEGNEEDIRKVEQELEKRRGTIKEAASFKFSDLKQGSIIQNKFSGKKYTVTAVRDKSADIQKGDDGRETEIASLNNYELVKEISSDLFKRTIDVARGRDEDERVSKLGSTFFNSFKGKSLLGGTIVNITTEKPSHGSYFDVSVQLAIPTQREDGSSFDRQSFIYYDVDRDDWNMKGKEYFITRQDARMLSQIATKINPDSKYKQPAAHFDIQGTQYGGKLYGGVKEARLTKKNLADYRYKPTNEMDNYPYEQILRGLRVELETMGIEGTPTAEEYQKALAKVLKNLEKDEIFYTNQVAGVKANRKRTDLMVDATPKNEVDKDNGLQKAQLKEAVKNIIKNILSEDFQDPDLYDPDEEREERRSRYGQNEFGDGEEVYEMYAEDDEIDYDDENFSDPFIDGDLEEATDTEADKNMVRKFMTMYETEPSKFERLHKQAQVQAATTKDIKFKHLLSLLDRAKAGALQSLSNQDKFEADREGMFESVSLKDLLD